MVNWRWPTAPSPASEVATRRRATILHTLTDEEVASEERCRLTRHKRSKSDSNGITASSFFTLGTYTQRLPNWNVRIKGAVVFVVAVFVCFYVFAFLTEFCKTLKFYKPTEMGSSNFNSMQKAAERLDALNRLLQAHDINTRDGSPFSSGVDAEPYDMLPCVDNCVEYRQKNIRGYKRMRSDVRLVIAGMVRNNRKGAANMIQIAKTTCLFFRECHLVIYENDSTDGTAEMLQQAAEAANRDADLAEKRRSRRIAQKSGGATASEDEGSETMELHHDLIPPRITLVQEVGVNSQPFFSFGAGAKLASKRYSIMAQLRNKVLAVVLDDSLFHNYTHVAVVDFDLLSWSIDGIANSFGWEAPDSSQKDAKSHAKFVDWDAVAANGLKPRIGTLCGESVNGYVGEGNRRRSLSISQLYAHHAPLSNSAASSGLTKSRSARLANRLYVPGNWMNYYDTLAFVDSAGRTPRVGEGMWAQITQRRNRPRPLMHVGETLVPVRSAFGGLAIYKRTSLARVAAAADTSLGDDRETISSSARNSSTFSKERLASIAQTGPYSGDFSEHVNLHDHMRKQGMHIYVNPSMVVLAGDNCNSANRVSTLERAIFRIGCDMLHWSVVGL